MRGLGCIPFTHAQLPPMPTSKRACLDVYAWNGGFALGAFARMVFQELPGGNIQPVGNALQRVNLYIAAPAFKRVDHLTRKADHQAKACLGKTHLLARPAEVVA